MAKWAPWVLDVGTKGFNVGTNLRYVHQNWRPNYSNFKNENVSSNATGATRTDHTMLALKNIQTKLMSLLIFGSPKKCGNNGASNDFVEKKQITLKGGWGKLQLILAYAQFKKKTKSFPLALTP